LQDVPSALFDPLSQTFSVSLQVPVVHEVSDAEQSIAAPEHVPDVQVSGSVQNRPSLQAVPSVVLATQVSVASLHAVVQSDAVGSWVHGSPVWVAHEPLRHVSVPLQ
jgi:hypothetical protein